MKGVAALPTVVIISVIILVAGLGIAGSSLVETLVTGGDYEAKIALYAAESGAQDAFQKMVRNKNFSTPYSLSVGGATSNVSFSGTNPKTITSEGLYRQKKKKIEIVISWDGNDKATYTSWKEVTN